MPYDSSGRIVPDTREAADDAFARMGRGGYAAQPPSGRGYTPPGAWALPAAEVPGWGAGGGGPEPYTRDISDLVRRAMQNGVRDQGAADWAVPPMGGGGGNWIGARPATADDIANYRPGMPSSGYGGGGRFTEPVPWTRDVSGFAMPSPKGPSPYGGGGGIAQLPWAMTPPMQGFWGDTGGDPTAYLARQQGGFGGLTRNF